jgi:hypothetical protein
MLSLWAVSLPVLVPLLLLFSDYMPLFIPPTMGILLARLL